MPQAAAVYARISADKDGSQLGVKRQIKDCLELARRRDWPVAEVYVDDDISAFNGKPRPAYRRLLADLKAGQRDAVIVWHLDRLHRQPKELEEFFDVCDAANVRHLASVTGDVDLATHDGRFMARILGAVARKSSDDMSRRIQRKLLERAEAGKPTMGGDRPYGYEPDRVTKLWA
jgi:site-specific DNA recombinase